MSTIVKIDFSRIIPRNTVPPRVAVADIVKLDGAGSEERTVKEGIAVNLLRGQVRECVPPGHYLVRLRVPTGQLLMKRVHVRDDGNDTALVFIPEGEGMQRGQEGKKVDRGLRFFDCEQFPQKLAPTVTSSKSTAGRGRWSARLVEPDERPAALNHLPGLSALNVVTRHQDYMGVVKLKTRPRINAFQRESGDKECVSSYLVGDIDAIQAARLYGHTEELHTHWKYPLRSQSIIGGAADEGKGARYFALSYQANNDLYPLQVACIPGRWVTQDGVLATVSVSYHPGSAGQRTRRAFRLEVDDPDFGGLIDFLQQGDLVGSMSIVDRSLEMLYQKWRNPYAAAGAGYVLLHAGLPHSGGWRNWRQWVLNLASRYTGLPDGAILYSTLLLQGPPGLGEALDFTGSDYEPFRTPLEATLEAVRRGPPLYRYGLKLLATNLEILEGEAVASRDVQRELEAARSYVSELSLRVDPDQPFCVFDVAG